MQIARWVTAWLVWPPKALGLVAGDETDIVAATRRTLEIKKDDGREQALAALDRLQWPLPAAYRFYRDDANRR